MKKKTKFLLTISIVLIIIIFILIFSYFGIIPIYKNGTDKELEFKINTDKKEYNINNSSIRVTITLKNKADNPVYVEKSFDINTNIKFNIISPKNNSFHLAVTMKSHIAEKRVLYPGDTMKYNFDLINTMIINDDGEIYDWSEVGNYKIQAIYNSLSGNIESNIIIFKINAST